MTGDGEEAAVDDGDRTTRPVVVIHTNDQQLVAARVSAYSLKARSQDPDRFDVRILRLEETPALLEREGQRYIRWPGWRRSVWRRSDFDSFQLLRRMVPSQMGFSGRALVIDPDVFAVGDVNELLFRDMGGKAVLCRERELGGDGLVRYSTAVMLLDCGLLTNWEPERELEEVFSGRCTLGPLLSLLDLPAGAIGVFEDEWNDVDRLTTETKLLHMSRLSTQPWRTGLWSDERGRVRAAPPWVARWSLQTRRILSAGRAKPRFHRPHPDQRQEHLFLSLLSECVRAGEITTDDLERAVAQRYVRRDLLTRMEEVTPTRRSPMSS